MRFGHELADYQHLMLDVNGLATGVFVALEQVEQDCTVVMSVASRNRSIFVGRLPAIIKAHLNVPNKK